MMAVGVLIVVGALLRLSHSGSGTIGGGSEVAPPVAVVLGLLGISCFLGGGYLYRQADTPGNNFRKAVAATPGVVTAMLLAVGITYSALPAAHPPTDRFGYTAAERQAFLSGCGGSERCGCLFDAIERSITHDEFLADNQAYMQTGRMPSEVLSVVTQSNC